MTNEIPSPAEVAAAERSYFPGRIPEEVWIEHLRLDAEVTFELAPFKIENGIIKIYMTRRPPNDPFYPNQLHMPGKMLNGGDESEEAALNRVKNSEMPDFQIHPPERIATYLRKTPRGTEGVFLHLVQVISGGNMEDWYDAENLPHDVIENHKVMIELAVKAIKAKGQKRQTAVFE